MIVRRLAFELLAQTNAAPPCRNAKRIKKPMRSPQRRLVSSMTALLSLLVLAAGERACAGFLGPNDLPGTNSVMAECGKESFGGNSRSDISENTAFSSASELVSVSSRDGSPRVAAQVWCWLWLPCAPLGHPQQTGDAGGSGGPNFDGSSHPAGCTGSPLIGIIGPTGVMSLLDHSKPSPPFHLPLYRPPRLG
jgi:hypothetical protein